VALQPMELQFRWLNWICDFVSLVRLTTKNKKVCSSDLHSVLGSDYHVQSLVLVLNRELLVSEF
jgi:hypothetical protein